MGERTVDANCPYVMLKKGRRGMGEDALSRDPNVCWPTYRKLRDFVDTERPLEIKTFHTIFKRRNILVNISLQMVFAAKNDEITICTKNKDPQERSMWVIHLNYHAIAQFALIKEG